MADSHFSAALHPLANPGYGKRSVPGQRPRREDDFTHLRPREAAVATYIDRLPDQSDISVKTLAKHTPYGQWAVGKALNFLITAGHLRRGLESVQDPSGSSRWVTRTWWSRTARDDAWWAAYQRGDVPVETHRPTRSRAYVLLAALGRENPVMSLSHTDCTVLAPLVDEWFARDATERQVLHALTEGLPVPVHHPAALARRRLIDKLPPAPPPRPRPVRILECGECGGPARADDLVAGKCGRCRGGRTAPPPTLPPARVHALATEARAAATRTPERPQAWQCSSPAL
ncbi:hypothetical protein J7E88_05495 [Streptomyces sp. ISL-10]|uniref:hypothetical protein n=1 Tax=Streptomyces sp. ISL-10 TaxID=2819172 RepID=UPI001BE7BAF5|nr:hypothetical protein [Streptomyces sp. ISL-10]MBT2364786.1 hypothetical protein [Streptomyces sp. ISL-10]